MAGLSDTIEAAVLNYLFKGSDMPTKPTELWVGLHNADPETTAADISGTGYTRAQLDPDSNSSTHTQWNAVASDGATHKVTNKGDITFAAAGSAWNGGNAIGYFGIWSQSGTSGGNLYASGQINGSNGVVVSQGTVLKFPGSSSGDGNLKVTID